MIVFKKIKIEGFGSIIGPLSYVLSRPGVNLIFGKNGSGKTTVFSALTWAIYGQTLKGSIEPWEDIMPEDYRGVKVEVSFKVGSEKVKVIRCRNYKDKIEGSKGASRLFLYINDEYQQQYRDIKSTQAKIIEILGMSVHLFKNSILFGQKLVRLLSEKGDKQKSIFEEAFDMPYISAGKKKAKEELDSLRLHFEETKSDYELKAQAYEHKKDKLESLQEHRANFEKDKEEQVQAIIAEIGAQEEHIHNLKKEKDQYYGLVKEEKALQIEHDNILKNIDKLKPKEQEHFKLDLHLVTKRKEIEQLKSELKAIKVKLSRKAKTCYVCEQPIDKKEHSKQIQGFKDQATLWKDQIKSLQKSIEEDENKLAKLSSSIETMDNLKSLLSSVKKSLESLNIYGFENLNYRPGCLEPEKIKLQNLKTKCDDTIAKEFKGSDGSEIKKELKELKKELKRLKPIYKSAKKQIKLHEWVIKDPLSNKGLKNYIFNDELSTINKQLKKYGKFLGYRIKLSMDLESGNKDFNALIFQGDNIRPYDDLSGGQAQLVDVCLAFATHDSIFSTRGINILIMDEVFENLDDTNIEIVTELIKIKSSKLPTHLITHRKEFLSSKIDYKINLNLNRSGHTEVL